MNRSSVQAEHRSLAKELTELSSSLLKAGSVQELFERLGASFRISAWRMEGSLIHLVYDNWFTDKEKYPQELGDGSLVHLDSDGLPPHFFTRRRCIRIEKEGLYLNVVDAIRTPSGERLSERAADRMRDLADEDSAVFGPLFVSGSPWGLLAFAWEDASPAELETFDLFFAQVGAAIELLSTKDGLLRSNQELQAIQSLAREGSPPGPAKGATLHELERQNELLSSFYLLGRTVSLSLDVDDLVDEALELLGESLSLDATWIYALEKGELIQEGARAKRGEELPSLPPGGDELCLVAAQERHPQILETDPGHFAVVPLLASNRAVGCLAMARHGGLRFGEHEMALLQSYAGQIAIAVERAQLSRSEQQRARQLRFLSEIGKVTTRGRLNEERLLSAYLHQACQTLGFDLGVGAFVSADDRGASHALRGELVAGAADVCPDEVLTLARQMADRVPTFPQAPLVEEIDWAGVPAQLCGLPLRTPTGMQAVIALARREEPITQGELETLEAANTSLAFALEHARRFETTKRDLDELELLLDVGQTITGTPDLNAILQTAADILSSLIDSTVAYIHLLDDDAQTLVGAACSHPGLRESFLSTEIPLAADTLAPRAVASKAPVFAHDVSDAPWLHQELVSRFEQKSVFAVPLMILGEPIGCIVISDSRGPREWLASEVERVTLVAHQVAIAATNARLDRELRFSHRALARAQAELVKKERLAALGELSAVIAHEVRNPLGVIFNSLSSLNRILEPEGDAKTLLEIVGEESDRLDQIVGDLLEFAKPNPLEPTLEAIGPLIDETILAMPSRPGVHIEAAIAPDLPSVMIDRRLIRQALLNLLENAAQSMPRGGTIHVHVGLKEGARGQVEITISDEGMGIPKELATKIFEPFFTTKATGTGLGLALVKRIIDAHQGRLLYRDRPTGTTFVVVLEAAESVDHA